MPLFFLDFFKKYTLDNNLVDKRDERYIKYTCSLLKKGFLAGF